MKSWDLFVEWFHRRHVLFFLIAFGVVLLLTLFGF